MYLIFLQKYTIINSSHLICITSQKQLSIQMVRMENPSQLCKKILQMILNMVAVNPDGSNHGKIFNSVNTLSLTKALSNFVVSNFLPIALISGVALGITNPTLGCMAHRYSLSTVSTFGIFLISGLKLQGGEIEAVAEAWPALVFGLAIFSCMPTTLSSGVALTQLVCGNAALALAMTVMSNLLGILIVPFWISRFLANDFGASIPTEKLLWSLIFTLLVPLVLGKLRKIFKSLATYVDQNRRIFSTASTILLSLTPWMQVSKSGALLSMVNPVVFLEAIGMGILGHIILLGFNAIALQSLSAIFGRESVFGKKENARALLVVASQKALLIVVAVVEQLGGALGESGLLVLPCVAAHINQIIIDSFLVNFWLQKDQSSSKIRKS
ncbi:hypothetical protein PVL29_008199 [Vitis rotundifolia]|uniref:Sodium/metabolite cotransporter BASS4, chloroplastic n=1 Tax=Vitis rotundifolia TaxID=103349 RepID=A0AA39A278_VITRO|nr:hypothetical protein PVL29_008199 [Vitis rotundifolia]